MLLYLATNRWIEKPQRQTMLLLMLASFFGRLGFFLLVSRSVSFFSHGVAGGDSLAYEYYAHLINELWRFQGVQYIGPDLFPQLGQVALICNVFAAIELFNGAPAPLAYTSLAALAGCITSLEIFRASREYGATTRGAYIAMILVLFGPAFIFHTSDCYKDGFVAMFTVMSFTSALRIARKFEASELVALSLWLTGLWFVRYYMVFMCSLPIAVGVLGVKSQSITRRVLTIFAVVAFVAASLIGGLAKSTAVSQAVQTFQNGSSQNSREWNAQGGSGVSFDDGGNPFGALGPKVLYTVASPFPWQGGSMGLQLGKLDVLLFYYLIYRAYLASRRLWKEDRMLLALFAVFVIPATIAYATTMSNIGLILRQRMPIVFVTAILASLSWSQKKATLLSALDARARALRQLAQR
jgi:hypothetical protein